MTQSLLCALRQSLIIFHLAAIVRKVCQKKQFQAVLNGARYGDGE